MKTNRGMKLCSCAVWALTCLSALQGNSSGSLRRGMVNMEKWRKAKKSDVTAWWTWHPGRFHSRSSAWVGLWASPLGTNRYQPLPLRSLLWLSFQWWRKHRAGRWLGQRFLTKDECESFTKSKAAIFICHACRILHFQTLETERLMKLRLERMRSCRHFCSRWPKTKFKGRWTERSATKEWLVFQKLVRQLMAAVRQNSVVLQ